MSKLPHYEYVANLVKNSRLTPDQLAKVQDMITNEMKSNKKFDKRKSNGSTMSDKKIRINNCIDEYRNNNNKILHLLSEDKPFILVMNRTVCYTNRPQIVDYLDEHRYNMSNEFYDNVKAYVIMFIMVKPITIEFPEETETTYVNGFEFTACFLVNKPDIYDGELYINSLSSILKSNSLWYPKITWDTLKTTPLIDEKFVEKNSVSLCGLDLYQMAKRGYTFDITFPDIIISQAPNAPRIALGQGNTWICDSILSVADYNDL